MISNKDLANQVKKLFGKEEPEQEEYPDSLKANHYKTKSFKEEQSGYLSSLNLSRLEVLKNNEEKQKHAQWLKEKYIPAKLKNCSSKYLTVRPEFLKQLGIPSRRYLSKDELKTYNLSKGTDKNFHQVEVSTAERAKIIEEIYPGLFEFSFEPVSFRVGGQLRKHKSRLTLQIR